MAQLACVFPTAKRLFLEGEHLLKISHCVKTE
jgi:hypothetical protein